MERPVLEVAGILRRFEGQYRQWMGGMSQQQARVVRALVACRTAALGGHVEACDACGHRQIAYNSCRDRHCPKCQAAATAEWLECERRHLLDVPYSHVVFTLPEALRALALQNPGVCYGLLFTAAAQTLLRIGADPKHLGARIGFVAILHTWGQTLLHHPHLHCLVPAGGLSPDGSRWVSCRPGFFLPVHVLGALFRGKYLALLRESHQQGRLVFHGNLRPLAEPRAFDALLRGARSRRWVVYAKPPFGGAEPALKYLARYTHRIAISNTRLLSVTDTGVSFSWKDYAHGNRIRRMELAPREFIRRFLLHVLPRGFVRIRRYGLLANRHREDSLARCRALLGQEAPPAQAHGEQIPNDKGDEHGEEAGKQRCPAAAPGGCAWSRSSGQAVFPRGQDLGRSTAHEQVTGRSGPSRSPAAARRCGRAAEPCASPSRAVLRGVPLRPARRAGEVVSPPTRNEPPQRAAQMSSRISCLPRRH